MSGLRAALAEAKLKLAGSSETPDLDAQLLLAHCLGIDRQALLLATVGAAPRPTPEGSWRERFVVLLSRRAAGEPLAYLTGTRSFRRLELCCDNRALVPRPETELLVEVGLELEAGARVVDVGTGCGAVALALKDERPDLELVGTDISARALSLARENAARLGLAVELRQADLLAGVEGRIDAVLCNPPYLPLGVPVAPELRHEPAVALFGGDDGLAVVRRLVAQLGGRGELRLAALEVGVGQAERVAALLGAAGFRRIESHRDLAGIERVVVGRRDG